MLSFKTTYQSTNLPSRSDNICFVDASMLCEIFVKQEKNSDFANNWCQYNHDVYFLFGTEIDWTPAATPGMKVSTTMVERALDNSSRSASAVQLLSQMSEIWPKHVFNARYFTSCPFSQLPVNTCQFVFPFSSSAICPFYLSVINSKLLLNGSVKTWTNLFWTLSQ